VTDEYPPDGEPFQISSEAIDLLYRAVSTGRVLSTLERHRALRAIDFIAQATLVVPLEDQE
jgi:hypothetical protein